MFTDQKVNAVEDIHQVDLSVADHIREEREEREKSEEGDHGVWTDRAMVYTRSCIGNRSIAGQH